MASSKLSVAGKGTDNYTNLEYIFTQDQIRGYWITYVYGYIKHTKPAVSLGWDSETSEMALTGHQGCQADQPVGMEYQKR